MKLETPFGCIKICVDGISVEYVYQERQPDPRWDVDGCYWIRVPVPENWEPHTVACCVDCFPDTEVTCESGEGVEMVSFRRGQLKMEIGIFEANDNHGTVILSDGIAYTIRSAANIGELVFGVAWLCQTNPENENNTWFSCDPTIL